MPPLPPLPPPLPLLPLPPGVNEGALVLNPRSEFTALLIEHPPMLPPPPPLPRPPATEYRWDPEPRPPLCMPPLCPRDC